MPTQDLKVSLADLTVARPDQVDELVQELNGETYLATFVVTKFLLFEVIVGYRFVKDHELTIGGHPTSSKCTKANFADYVPLYVMNSVTIPPLSQKFIDVTWEDTPRCGNYLVVRNNQPLERRGLLLALVLTQLVNNKVCTMMVVPCSPC
jgi:hypothetical protein